MVNGLFSNTFLEVGEHGSMQGIDGNFRINDFMMLAIKYDEPCAIFAHDEFPEHKYSDIKKDKPDWGWPFVKNKSLTKNPCRA